MGAGWSCLYVNMRWICSVKPRNIRNSVIPEEVPVVIILSIFQLLIQKRAKLIKCDASQHKIQITLNFTALKNYFKFLPLETTTLS